MKVRVIGSGSMWTSYNSASYMIDDDIVVDMPNGMCKYLFKFDINPRKINNILITHFHGDHYFDIPFYFLLKSRSDNKTTNIYCSYDGKKKNFKLLKLAFPNSAKDIVKEIGIQFNLKNNIKLNNYLVTKYVVNHGRMKPAFGYILENEKNKIGFTGDTALCKNVEEMARRCDYLFCDCMFIKGTSKHMGIDNITYLSEKYLNCKFVVSHMEDVTREELSKLKLNNVIVPKDGEEIII